MSSFGYIVDYDILAGPSGPAIFFARRSADAFGLSLYRQVEWVVSVLGDCGIRLVHEPGAPGWRGFEVDDRGKDRLRRCFDLETASDAIAAIEAGQVQQLRRQQENNDCRCGPH